MLSVKLICVGKMKEKFFSSAYDEYAKRLGAFCKLETEELPESKLSDDPSDKEIMAATEKEGREILKRIPAGAYVVAMCIEGRQMTSEEMADVIKHCADSGKSKLCFIIGGSVGLHPEVKEKSDLKLSMSKMTFPHHLARVMLAEQIYRGFTIINGKKYHK